MHHVETLHQEGRVFGGDRSGGSPEKHGPHPWVQEDFLGETVFLSLQGGRKERQEVLPGDGVPHKVPRMLKRDEKVTDGDLLAQTLPASNRSHRRALNSRGTF